MKRKKDFEEEFQKELLSSSDKLEPSEYVNTPFGTNGSDEEYFSDHSSDVKVDPSTRDFSESSLALPPEILVSIFKFLDIKYIGVLALCCQYWRVVTLLDTLWRFHYFNLFETDDFREVRVSQSIPTRMVLSQLKNYGMYVEFNLVTFRNKFLQRFICGVNLKKGYLSKQYIDLKNSAGTILELCNGKILFGDKRGKINVYCLEKCEVINTFKAHHKCVSGIEKYPGKRFVSVSSDCSIKLWNENYKLIAQKMKGRKHALNCCSVYKKMIFTGDIENIQIHKLSMKEKSINIIYEVKSFRSSFDYLHLMHCCPEQKELIVSGGKETCVYDYDSKTRTLKKKRSQKHEGFVWSFKVSKNFLFTVSTDGRVRITNRIKPEEKKEIYLKIPLCCVDLSEDERYLMVGLKSGSLLMYKFSYDELDVEGIKCKFLWRKKLTNVERDKFERRILKCKFVNGMRDIVVTSVDKKLIHLNFEKLLKKKKKKKKSVQKKRKNKK